METLTKFRKLVMFAVKLSIVFSVTCIFIEIWSNFYRQALFSFRGNFVVILSFVLLFVIFCSTYGAFKIGISRIHEIAYSFSLSFLITDVLMYLELSLVARELVPVLPMVGCVALHFLTVLAGSYCANTIYFYLYHPRKIAAVFSDRVDGFALIRKMSKISERFDIACGLNVDCTPMEEIKRQIDHYEAVVLCGMDKNKQKELMTYCYSVRKRTYLLPDITDIMLKNSYGIQISDTPVLMCRNRGLAVEQEFVKRFFDIVLSVIGIILAGPIMIACAVAIKLDDGGPVFFRQNRVTKSGRIFNILKFRSMIVDADKDGAKKAVNDDDRITRVGRFIRSCRMDELPQLFNILRGDLSLVGPRPERVENVYEYSNAYPEFDLRHRVKAGLTGYAQLYGKYNTTPEDKLNMDLIYIETFSLLQDLKLIVLTFKILFMKESTEGFDESANKNVRPSEFTINGKDDNNGV